MLIIDLWGISFHAVVVFGLGKDLLFKSALGCCVKYLKNKKFLEGFDQFLTQKNDFESTNFEMFEEVAHNFGKSNGDIT